MGGFEKILTPEEQAASAPAEAPAAPDSNGSEIGCCCDFNQTIPLEPCDFFPAPVNITTDMKCEGRLLTVNVTLANVCKDKLINLGVLVCDNVGENKVFIGFKVKQFMVPSSATCTSTCCTAPQKTFCFVIPDENICTSGRTLDIRVISHYTSSNTPCPSCFQ